MEVRARPAALRRFADALLGPDAALRAEARRLHAVLATHRRANPELGGDLSALASRLHEVAERAVALDVEAGRTARAFELADRAAGGGEVTVGEAGVERFHARLRSRWEHVADLRERVVSLDEATWMRLVWGRAGCPPPVAGGTYRGGGAVVGPDGRRYPLVIPELEVDGRTVNLSADPTRDPADLGGADPGWRTITTATGVANVQNDLRGWERAIIGAGMLAGLQHGLDQPRASRRAHAALEFDATGRPVAERHDAREIPAPPGHTDGNVQPGRKPWLGHGGLPKTQAAGGAIDLLANAGHAALVLRDLEGHGGMAYRLEFEQHELEDRRRARLTLYDLRSLGGEQVVVPSVAYVQGDRLRRVPAVLGGAAPGSVGPPRRGARVVGTRDRHTRLPPRYAHER